MRGSPLARASLVILMISLLFYTCKELVRLIEMDEYLDSDFTDDSLRVIANLNGPWIANQLLLPGPVFIGGISYGGTIGNTPSNIDRRTHVGDNSFNLSCRSQMAR